MNSRIRSFCLSLGFLLYLLSSVPGVAQTVPHIVAGPVSTNVMAGASVAFSVTATGAAPLSYHWLRDGVPVQSGGVPNHAILYADLSHAGSYVVVVSNALGVVYSQRAILTVESGPVVEVNPVHVVARLGDTAVFQVTVTGSLPLSYQWRRYNVDIPGATSDTLQLPNVQVADAGDYDVFVANAFGSTASEAAQLTVLVPPMIITQPSSQSADIGDPVTLCAQATGSGSLLYQWRKNGVNIPGATDNCYSISSVDVPDGGEYTVVIANAVGAVTSDRAVLTVSVSKISAGDDFGDSVSFDEQVLRGSTTGATKEQGEPDHAGDPGGRSVWYSRTSGDSGIATIRTLGSAFDTLLAVYVGTAIDDLTLVAEDEDRGSFFSSELQFVATEGTTYFIVVDGFNGVSGDFLLSWDLEITSDPLPTILAQPVSQTVALGGNVAFLVNASGSGLEYQWYFNGRAIPGERSDTLRILGVQRQHVGAYTVDVVNEFNRSVFSNPVVLEIGPTSSFQSIDKIPNPVTSSGNPLKGGGSMNGVNAASGSGLGLAVAAGTTASQIVNNTNTTTQPGEPNHCGVLGGSTRWLVLTTPETGMEFAVDTIGSDIDTVLAVYSRATILDPLVEETCDSSALSGGAAPSVTFSALPGIDYWIAVDGVGGAEGVIQLNWRLGSFPDIATSGSDETVVLGSTLNWLLELQGDTPSASVQWRHNGDDIPDAIGMSFSLADIQGLGAGLYTVMVSNLMGMVEMDVAQVTVDSLSSLLAESTFEAGDDEWVIEHELSLDTPVHLPPAGLEDGHVRFSDAGRLDVWYWAAPLPFLGNKSAAYGGCLEFQQFQNPAVSGLTDPDVILEGSGLRLVLDLPGDPGPEWTGFSITLDESADWRVDEIVGPTPTQLQMLHVLQNLSGILIRGDFGLSNHESGLDNVRMVAPVQTDVTLLDVRVLNTGQIQLEWPANASGFQLQSSPSLIPGDWQLLPDIPILINGFRQVLLPPSAAGAFYRLQQP